jgi:dihydroorotate dehydrogenase
MSLLPYALVRPLLFAFDAETVHEHTIDILASTQHNVWRHAYQQARIEDPVSLAGLSFPNRVGLAAGLDKNARCIDAWEAMGFGFVEVGTVTPLGQAGNPKPRMFRLPAAHALINRLGFNNDGLSAFLANVQQARFRNASQAPMLLGLNIGKNASTPMERATDDYLTCLNAVYPFADYVTVNISSPNTQNLRSLQTDEAFAGLLHALNERRQQLADQHQKHVPLFIKIAPDLTEEQLAQLANTLRAYCMNGESVKDQAWGLIATNTTLSRDAVKGLPNAQEAGGLSGTPVRDASNRVITALRAQLGVNFPIIGVGGIMTAEDAVQKVEAGADLVQIYTGLIYQGPKLIRQVGKALLRKIL